MMLRECYGNVTKKLLPLNSAFTVVEGRYGSSTTIAGFSGLSGNPLKLHPFDLLWIYCTTCSSTVMV